MKENDFDIFVRNAMADAEETVSPKVWEGVSKAIGKPRRVFPLWARWSSAAAGVAAALVAGVFLFKPQQHSESAIAEEPVAQIITHSAMKEEPAPVQVQADHSTPVEVVKNMPVRFAQAPVLEAIAPEPILGMVRPVQEKLLSRTVSGMVNMQDTALLDKLAMAENPAPRENSLSLTVSGNMQGTQRRQASPGPRRLFAAGGLMPPMEEGISEGPETGFGLPFSVGLGVNFKLNSRWSIGTGVRYSYLSRTFAGRYIGNNDQTPATAIDNDQHWIGIPVNVYFNVISLGRWRMHAFVGGAGEYMVDNHFLVHYSPQDIHYHKKEKAPIQWSGAAGLGAEFKLTPVVGIYLDPSVRYYFRTDLQPARSLRTIQPLMFDVEMGLRFSF